MGSGCGTVGRAIDSDTRDPRLKSSHRQLVSTTNCNENKEKLTGNGPIKIYQQIQQLK